MRFSFEDIRGGKYKEHTRSQCIEVSKQGSRGGSSQVHKPASDQAHARSHLPQFRSSLSFQETSIVLIRVPNERINTNQQLLMLHSNETR